MRRIFFFLIFPCFLFAQANYVKDLETAYNNAKKGIHWALSNIPESKSSLSKDLIENDRLVSEVKLSKEVEGVKIEAKGVFNSYEVRVVIYRSYESLEAEGY